MSIAGYDAQYGGGVGYGIFDRYVRLRDISEVHILQLLASYNELCGRGTRRLERLDGCRSSGVASCMRARG